MLKVVLATSNAGKIREIQQNLQTCEIVSQDTMHVPNVLENGITFVENALLKARNAAIHTRLPAIADDSGLEVDYLKSKPGVHSARFAGSRATDQENIAKLLNELTDVPTENRRARFQCVMVFLKHAADPTPIICQGTWEGEILLQPRGSGGFGYDPIFFDPILQCCAAELTLEQKNAVSHRGKALKQLAEYLQNIKI